MKKEIDFSKGEKGKFHRADMKIHFPIYLNAENAKFISHLAKKKGQDHSQIVNDILKKDIKLFELIK